MCEEIIAENSPNLGKEIASQAMKVHRSPNTREPRKTTPRPIIIKMAKIQSLQIGKTIKSSQREK